ncbi:hypothetical protein ACE7GA_26350 [Roseomonas sp. CCTCC AB2023176]|uniref:hypothetical protein n=1 Tax=Roseomonas sp. CCTCC AB2023176 TaxID=3342640 RepID=UPI0035D9298A
MKRRGLFGALAALPFLHARADVDPVTGLGQAERHALILEMRPWVEGEIKAAGPMPEVEFPDVEVPSPAPPAPGRDPRQLAYEASRRAWAAMVIPALEAHRAARLAASA